MNLMKREVAGNGKRTHWIALCGDFALEELVDLSQDRLQNA
jgi:hypothetical protein